MKGEGKKGWKRGGGEWMVGGEEEGRVGVWGVRAARHYEAAMYMIIRHAVMASSKVTIATITTLCYHNNP